MSVHHEAAVHAGAWPVMYADFGEARKPMTFATSSGVSMRPSGTELRRALVNSAGLMPRRGAWSRGTLSHISVSPKPGQTQFARMASAAWAGAGLLVMLMT